MSPTTRWSSLRPVVPVHLSLLGVDIVGKHDVPALLLKGKPHQTDAGEELGEFQRGGSGRRLHRQAVRPLGQPFQGQKTTGFNFVAL